MHITQIGLEYLPPLSYTRLDCNERVNLILGPNASGKSTILRAVKGLHSLASGGPLRPPSDLQDGDIDNSADGIYFNYSGGQYPIMFMEASGDWKRDDSGGTRWDEVPFLYIPATRINLPVQHIFDQKIEDAEEIVEVAPLKRLLDTESGIFDGRYVELAIAQLLRGMSGSRIQQDQFLRGDLWIGYSCAQSICNEVMSSGIPRPYVDEYETLDARKMVHHSMGIITNDVGLDSESLYAGALSAGTQGTLLWIWAFVLKMADHYSFERGWPDKPAILLIDEIENHLHPTWQRRVIPALLEHFPGLQIFATTHSPFVVAGLKAGQVHLLNRDENGVVTASTNTEDIVGWTADEILRNLMGVDDPTDNDTAEAAREFRRLRNEGPRSEPEQEAGRQERMEELRRFLSRELLAGGAEAAQRELFERQFAEALEKYRKSQEINQENG